MTRKDKWRDTRVPESRCPYCDYKLDAAGHPDGHTPSEGDASVCLSCAQVMVFAADLTVRKPTPEERREIEADPRVQQYQRAVRQIDRRELPSQKEKKL